jgi:hypothetical protein
VARRLPASSVRAVEAGLADPPGEEGVGVAGGGREEEAGGFAGDVGDAGELAAAGDDGLRRGLVWGSFYFARVRGDRR